MVTLVIERDTAGPPRNNKADGPIDTAPDQPRPMPPLAALKCAVEIACLGLIFALFLLRGLDAVIHG